MLQNLQNYYQLSELIQNGTYTLHTKDLNKGNWDEYYNGVLNIIRDGIELDEIHILKINVVFEDNEEVSLSVFDLYFNIMMWYLPITIEEPLTGDALFFPKAMTKKAIKSYLDKYIIKVRSKINPIHLNNILDDTIYHLETVDEFSFYLCNTINLKDTIELMNRNKDFNNLIHTSIDKNVSIEDVKDVGMKKANQSVDIIEDSEKYLGYDHCLKNSFMTEEGINKRQYKELMIHIGTKPDGKGGIHSHIINSSYVRAGLDSVESQYVDSASARVAQNQTKHNTGSSGNFARIIGINNMDSFINPDMDFVCDTQNFQIITIENEKFLSMLVDRYYRLDPDGPDLLIQPADTWLIGKTIYLFSPMTCASAAHGHGVCRRCYGNLAYINSNIRIGKFASETLTAQLTQKQLSAKHLLETLIKKFHWTKAFTHYFEIEVNNIVPKEIAKNCSIVINPDSIMFKNDEDEYIDGLSDNSLNKYITEFTLIDKTGNPYQITSEEEVNMYITDELKEIMNKSATLDDGSILINLNDAIGEDGCMMNLFAIGILNNDLGKDLADIENLINKRNSIKGINYDKDQLLTRLIQLIIKGKINIQSIHLETILMNQLRSARSKLRFPNWDDSNAEYQILTLDQSLKENPCIVNSLIYKNLKWVLTNPSSFEKTESSKMDMFFMERPQEFLSSDLKTPKKKEFIDPIFVKPNKK